MSVGLVAICLRTRSRLAPWSWDFLGWKMCPACKVHFRENTGPHLLVPEDAIIPLMATDFRGAVSVPEGEAGALTVAAEDGEAGALTLTPP